MGDIRLGSRVRFTPPPTGKRWPKWAVPRDHVIISREAATVVCIRCGKVCIVWDSVAKNAVDWCDDGMPDTTGWLVPSWVLEVVDA